MKGSYEERATRETEKPPLTDVLMRAAWRCATQGEDLTQTRLVDCLCEEYDVSPNVASAWLVGVNVLSDYMTRGAAGDAIDEERDALQTSREAVRLLLQGRMQHRIDSEDDELRGGVVCSHPQCGRKCSSRGRRSRTRMTLLGSMTTWRRWSSCPDHGGFSASDERLLLPDSDFTAPVEEAATLLATTVTFETAAALLCELMGVAVSDHAIQDMTNDRGRYVAQPLDEEGAEDQPFESSGLERSPRPRPLADAAKPPKTAYIEVDGVYVMTRDLDEAASAPVEVSRLGHWMLFALVLWLAVLKLRFDEAQKLVATRSTESGKSQQRFGATTCNASAGRGCSVTASKKDTSTLFWRRSSG